MAADVSFFELTERYPNEASAEAYFIKLRWPAGVRCTSCKATDVHRGTQKSRRRQFGIAASA